MTALTASNQHLATTSTGIAGRKTRRLPALLRFIAPGMVAFGLAVGSLATTGAQDAAALTQVQPPSGFFCENGNLRVAPARAWATRGTETVVWVNQVQRWNGSAWAVYATFNNYAAFDTFGRNQSGWSMFANTRGGTFVNSRLSLPVQHQGYYRILTVVGNNTLTSVEGYIGGGSNYCWMP